MSNQDNVAMREDIFTPRSKGWNLNSRNAEIAYQLRPGTRKSQSDLGSDAPYLATAARLGCPLLSWDEELIARGGAQSSRDWLAASRGGLDPVPDG
jgi:hypothetical protein